MMLSVSDCEHREVETTMIEDWDIESRWLCVLCDRERIVQKTGHSKTPRYHGWAGAPSPYPPEEGR